MSTKFMFWAARDFPDGLAMNVAQNGLVSIYHTMLLAPTDRLAIACLGRFLIP